MLNSFLLVHGHHGNKSVQTNLKKQKLKIGGFMWCSVLLVVADALTRCSCKYALSKADPTTHQVPLYVIKHHSGDPKQLQRAQASSIGQATICHLSLDNTNTEPQLGDLSTRNPDREWRGNLEDNMATFMGPYSQSIEPDIRLEDYLDDKLQSTTDLENLDTLLASVEYQRSQLQSQLDDATKELEESRKSSADRQATLSSQIQEFQTLQKSIDVRLQILAASDAPDEAIRRLEQPMKQLHKVDLAHKYLLLLQDVEELRSAARSHLPKSPKAALEPYSRLKQLSMRLKELQPAADEAAAHLVTHVANISSNLWDEMKQTMWNELEAVLTKRGWPKIDPQLEIDDEWRECFEKLLDLQVPELIYSKDVVTLLPIDVMAQIFVKEFRFHFMSDKTTSSPQAIGTHCFPWFLALVERWEDFLRDNFTYIVASKLHDSAASGKMVYMDPVCAFISSMLPVMREKVNSAMVEAVKSPTFLSSLIAQLLSFDEALRSRFNYDGGDVENGWGGLTAEVLDKDFAKWLRAEKDFALERFQGIMGSQDARNIDYEFAGAGKTKPTYGAVRVTDLLRSVTSQYERVRRFSHKLRFLIDIQLAILDEYHSRLRGSLEVYQSLTSTVGRTLHGVTKEELAALEGTGALETLCKVFGSSDHIVNTLKDWSNEEVSLGCLHTSANRLLIPPVLRHALGATPSPGKGLRRPDQPSRRDEL